MSAFQLIVLLGTATAMVAMAYLGWQRLRQQLLEQHATVLADEPYREGSSSPSTPPPIESVAPAAPKRPMTVREQRDQEVQTRWETGLCLYCEQRATHARPRLRLVTSLLDPIYRRLGVVPRDRHRIEVNRRNEHDSWLCEDHHYLARARLEAKLSEASQSFALHVIEERNTLVTFERYELDEDMKAQAEATRRGRPGAEVRPLRSANGG